MRKSRLAFTALLVPLDFLFLSLAGVAAYLLRRSSFVADLRPLLSEIPFSEYLALVAASSAVWLLIFALAGLYRIQRRSSFIEELFTVVLACSAGLITIVIVIFFSRELFSSRFIILAAWILAILFVALGRALVRVCEYVLLKRGIGATRVVLVGTGEEGESLARAFFRDPRHGYKIVARFDHVGEGEERKMVDLKLRDELDEVIVVDPTLPRGEMLSLIDFTNDHHLAFQYAADLFGVKAVYLDTQSVAGVPLIAVKKTPLEGWGRIAKRAVDIVVSSLGLVILSPLFILIALAVLVDSPGPTFVRLLRVGQGGRTFPVVKFRSMVVGADKMKQELLPLNERSGPLFKMAKDPRVTRVGRALRKTFLDELPQLANVLKGEMSLVGPRPHEPGEVNQYARSHRKLLAVRPGMTGLAQVSGHSSLSFEEEAKLDLFYIEHWSLSLDLAILLKTPWTVLSRPAI